ncbi:MAG: hypothetical protein II049_08370 [Clostridia bacterium]|nr:hypothetical protein [Clostridia bacterium]
MMNRQEVINALRAFPYDCSAYWVVAGGAMVLHGVREETGDIDLGCSEALADRLETDGFLYQRRADGSRWFKYGERIEIFEKWMYDRTETVEGVRVISIDGLIQMKQALGRDKDLHDIALLRAFQGGKGEHMEEQIIQITVRSKGEACTLSDEEIKKWYEERIAALFDSKWGTPEITVDVERKEV